MTRRCPRGGIRADVYGGRKNINLSDWEAELGKPIQRLELVVAAVPSNWKRDQDLPAFSGPYRGPVLDRYVYELKISGAWPQGHEPQALREAPGVSGAVHANGGGFVADTASVARVPTSMQRRAFSAVPRCLAMPVSRTCGDLR
ncbi:hypothetical protein [Candidatus Reidiella endopervernicosa]|uniref:Uncharacterized protein n=1 Tax=Candidatus Reidiella endopervernicosa TaxID=2738883 RepID=A0A6N0HUG7_9GAMM|nr:hypothetical protein [Candidatus Reidiella endopervernicosa]QKQ25806.1 hypothetical protein HUE57_05565 [Candidatus Reidiella endopervernicosa]